MKCLQRLWVAILLLPLLIPVMPAAAQDEEKSAPAVTAEDPGIAEDELRLLLKPLTKEELGAEVKAWRGLLQEKVKTLSAVEIQAKKAEGEEKGKLVQKTTELKEAQTALIDRVEIVISALEEKGGEVEDYKKYIAAVSGFAPELEVTDVSATWTRIRGWLESKEGGLRWGKNILFFVLTLIVFWILAVILANMTRRAVSKIKKASDLLKDFFVNSVRRVTFFIGIVVALSMLEVDIGPFLAAIGVVGFVVGFALQGTLSNFASGVMILLYRPYDIGDVVDVAGVKGVVNAMSLVSTTIKSFDNQNIVVPNNSIWGGVITNATANDTRRIDMTFSISYSDDLDKAQGIIEEIVTGHPLALKDPEPLIKMHELGDSSINFIARPWSKTGDYWKIYWDVTRAVKDRFDKEGISIPFPQRDVHLYKAGEG